MNSNVDFFFNKTISGSKHDWRDALNELRTIALDSGLTETLKWGVPCYTLDNRNVVLIHAFKEYVALLFFKGALLKDPANILIQQTDNVQAARQIRFTNLLDIIDAAPTLKAYIVAAIEIEKSGEKVPLKKTAEYALPIELSSKLDTFPALHTAFYALTPGRQRAYILHFSAAKQSATRTARVEKCIPQILQGKGLND